MITTILKCGTSNSRARITSRGQLVTAPLGFSQFYTNQNAVDNTAVNLVKPKAGKRFVITDIVLSGDRSIAANGAVVDLFENSTGPTNGTVTTQIYQDEIAKQTRAVLVGLNIIVSEGVWVNLKADDTIVRANIGGYYIEA